MDNDLTYAVIEVGGIQNYILNTGKLKEMIGGSQLVEDLSKGILENALKEQGFTLVEPHQALKPEGDKVLALQRNAGEIHLLFASRDKAKKFISSFIWNVSTRYPGLPIFGALNDESEPCSWEDKGSYARSRGSAQSGITRLRNRAPVTTGMSMLPLCRQARLDALPAVDNDSGEFRSVCSRTKQSPWLLEAAERRLHEKFDDLTPGCRIKWTDNIETLAGTDSKVAYIHIDGNDLGKLFRSFLESDEYKNMDVEHSIKAMGSLSSLVENSTRRAMDDGLRAIIRFEYENRKGSNIGSHLTVPARPLVQGGDDVTIVVRADLALLFVDQFVSTFEREAVTEIGGRKIRLSVGVGMVICQMGYPFIRAFNLSEELLKNAKDLTKDETVRPSSLDYLVITNEVENDLDVIRHHIAKTEDKKTMLTAKPLILSGNNLYDFVKKGLKVLDKLPRSTVRPAMNLCRKGKDASKSAFETLERNINRQLGGRASSELMTADEFNWIFPEHSFFTTVHSEIKGRSAEATCLGDWLELPHLLPADQGDKNAQTPSDRITNYLAMFSVTEEKQG